MSKDAAARPRRRPAPRALAALLLAAALLAALLVSGCGGAQQGSVQVPARVRYFEATSLRDQQITSEAINRLNSLVEEHPGTRLGTFAYLKLGDLHVEQNKWAEADTNYRLFLTLNSNSHLTPYALYRLMQVNYQQSLTGLFFPTREVDRDMEPNRQLILEYKRFFLLYRNSAYLEEVRPFYLGARETLARHEEMVGDFYMDRQHYNAAANRYRYLLRHYPQYPSARRALEKLIRAYRANRQPDLAREMERIYNRRYEDTLAAPEGEAAGGPVTSLDPSPEASPANVE